MCNIDKIYIECKLCFQKLLLLEQHLIALSKNFFPVSIVLYPECMNVQDIGDTFKICAYHMHTVYALSFSRVTFTAHVSHLRFKKWGFSRGRAQVRRGVAGRLTSTYPYLESNQVVPQRGVSSFFQKTNISKNQRSDHVGHLESRLP